MKSVSYIFAVLVLAWQLLAVTACNNKDYKNAEKRSVTTEVNKNFKPKPTATYADTLIINFSAAVFYHPDSLQLLKIKAQTDSMVFDGAMHEFFYQMRNARMVIQKTWLHLKITEAKNYRYLLFITEDNKKYCIDLDTKNDAYGLLVFNRKKLPLTVDMMNIETEVSFYLKDYTPFFCARCYSFKNIRLII
jgi:hypothetical protein